MVPESFVNAIFDFIIFESSCVGGLTIMSFHFSLTLCITFNKSLTFATILQLCKLFAKIKTPIRDIQMAISTANHMKAASTIYRMKVPGDVTVQRSLDTRLTNTTDIVSTVLTNRQVINKLLLTFANI